jgi:hypothetical protein
MKPKVLKAKILDRKFDRGEEIVDHLDLKNARRIGDAVDPPRKRQSQVGREN